MPPNWLRENVAERRAAVNESRAAERIDYRRPYDPIAWQQFMNPAAELLAQVTRGVVSLRSSLRWLFLFSSKREGNGLERRA